MMIALICALAIASLSSVSATNTIYLSVFGSDSNSGKTPAEAVASLGKAYALAKSTGYQHITLGAGVVELQPLKLSTDLTIVSEQNNPSLAKLACRSSSGECSSEC